MSCKVRAIETPRLDQNGSTFATFSATRDHAAATRSARLGSRAAPGPASGGGLARFLDVLTASVGSVAADMAGGFAVGGDLERALDSVGVPSYVLDTTGIVRWINPAAERLLGDIRGRHYTSIVTPEESRRARELFSQKVLGTAQATDATGVLVSTAGTRVAVEVSSVPLKNGERVVGVFGLIEERPDKSRCFVFSSRGARRSRSPPSST
jgi:PAS domain S-box-containing protein